MKLSDEVSAMTDPILGVGGNFISAKKADQKESEVSLDNQGAVRPNPSVEDPGNGSVDRVQLSNEVVAELDRAGFDEEKVAQIKQALADGDYPIDTRRIAEGFTEFEKLL